MRKLREILKLKLVRKLSHRRTAESLGVSAGAVGSVMARSRAKGLTTWAAVEPLSEVELDHLLYGAGGASRKRPTPDPVWIHSERQKSKKVTLDLLHLEYLVAHPDGYKYTAFCDRYRRWLKKQQLSMRQVHRVGEKMFVDYSGATVAVVDPKTGESRKAEVFVAVLGASSYTFVEATWTQQLPDWTASHARAVEYFGGVTQVWVPDQLRSAVSGPHRYDPDLNRTYAELADHYNAIVIPARPRKPKDKAKAESGVLVAQRRILARLRNETFFGLAALNERIAELLDELNDRPMKGYGGQSRRERYELLDRPALQSLPSERYVYAVWSKQTVGLDYHVDVDEHAYSVPYQLAKETVELRCSAATVEVYFRGNRVASHRRSHDKGAATTNKEHMSAAHRAHADISPTQLIERAARIGPDTERLISDILNTRRHPEQGYRASLGILQLEKQYGAERLELAATRAMLTGLRRCRQMETMLKSGLDRLGTVDLVTDPNPPAIEHGNVRGADYYN
jgi:transposase